MRAKRKKLEGAWVIDASGRAQMLVQRLPEWRRAAGVFCYIAKKEEVQTAGLLQACWGSGKRLFVPAFRRDAGRYEPAEYDGGELFAGYGSVREPARPEWIMENKPAQHMIDLAIVPGVAFDRAGNRLGHGRAHYDRLLGLEPLKSALKLGLAFEFQVLDCVPRDAHDAVMDVLVTESNVYRIEKELN